MKKISGHQVAVSIPHSKTEISNIFNPTKDIDTPNIHTVQNKNNNNNNNYNNNNNNQNNTNTAIDKDEDLYLFIQGEEDE